MKWGWEGKKKAVVNAFQVEDEEDSLNDPRIPKCGSGAGRDASSHCNLWSSESKCKAFFDLVIINGLIVFTCFWDLYSFIVYTDG
jgi:hypothetical protein